MKITKNEFGQINRHQIIKYTLQNDNNYSAEIINYGGILVSFTMPDNKNNISNINLGFDNLNDYINYSPFFGALIGRFANRIAKGKFILNNKNYQLALNDNINHLHGGNYGYDKVIWQSKEFRNSDEIGLELKYISIDGEENYPGNVNIEVTYALNNNNELKIEYSARSDRATPFNMTQHSYWNLNGAGNETILDHQLLINSDRYLKVDKELIPTGEIGLTKDTPFDFLKLKEIRKKINMVKGGYDHCFILNNDVKKNNMLFAAQIKSADSGRSIDIYTTKPALQFYSGNFLDNLKGPDNLIFKKHGAFCLETQYYPDAVNHANFPSCILKPGELYKHTTIYKFDIE